MGFSQNFGPAKIYRYTVCIKREVIETKTGLGMRLDWNTHEVGED